MQPPAQFFNLFLTQNTRAAWSFLQLAAIGYVAVASASAAITIGTTPPQGTTGQAYNSTLAASGGASPYFSRVSSGDLPPGLILTPEGLLTGTPQAAGLYSFSVQSTDSLSNTGVSNLTIRIVSSNGLPITTTTLPEAKVGVAYDTSLVAQDGTGPYSFDLVVGKGMLPPAYR